MLSEYLTNPRSIWKQKPKAVMVKIHFKKTPSIVIGAVALVSAICASVFLNGYSSSELRPFRISNVVPRSNGLGDWRFSFRQIGDTVEMAKTVRSLLKFDEAICFTTEFQGEETEFYVAYWKEGKMSHRFVAGPPRDVCWVGAGWACSLHSKRTFSDFGFDYGDSYIEVRIFSQAGQVRNVTFCHRVGGRSVSYDTVVGPPWNAAIADIFKMGLRQRQEQVFFRISSIQNVDKFMNSVAVQLFLKQLVG